MGAEAAAKEVVTLNNGVEMPLLGLGTWQCSDEQVEQAVAEAIKAGYRHIDGAKIYGNEKGVGNGLKKAFNEGWAKREDVWVTSKLWQTDTDKPEEAIRQTLSDLGLEYLDLYLVHWPVTGNEGPELIPPLEEVWKGMERLYEKGLTRAIGISNFSTKKVQRILDSCTVKPMVHQVEMHVGFHNERQRKFCHERGIHLSAYSPLGSQQGDNISRRPMDDEEVADLAKQKGVGKAEVMLRYCYQKGASVLPKAKSAEHIRSNMNFFALSLSDDEMKKLDNVKPQRRIVPGRPWLKASGPYRTLDELWDGEMDADEY